MPLVVISGQRVNIDQSFQAEILTQIPASNDEKQFSV